MYAMLLYVACSQQYGPDLLYIRNALTTTLKRYNINRSKVALAGFSDGATYALSLGTSGGPFNYVIAFSPGGYVPANTRVCIAGCISLTCNAYIPSALCVYSCCILHSMWTIGCM